MEFSFKGNKMVFNRELTELDELVLKFVAVLDRLEIDYVIFSGYVVILFGRSRNTEDVDVFVRPMSFEKFSGLWTALEKAGLECINVSSPKHAFESYLQEGLALRFAEKGSLIPNFEVKFPKDVYHNYPLVHPLEVLLNGRRVRTSELEFQIAFKLQLGSEKDFEDARHLYKIFKEHLNLEKLKSHVKELRVEKVAGEILWQEKL